MAACPRGASWVSAPRTALRLDLAGPRPTIPSARSMTPSMISRRSHARTWSRRTGALATGRYEPAPGARPALSLARRWELPKFVAADGFVVSEDGARELLRDFLAEHRYSPSALEQLAVCPYRFYLRSIVRVAGPDRRGQCGGARPARARRAVSPAAFTKRSAQLTVGETPRAIDLEAAEAALDTALTQLQVAAHGT